MEKHKNTVVCTTLLVETSPQAIPLGCACIASSIKKECEKAAVEIIDFSPEDDFLLQLNDSQKIDKITKKLIDKNPSVVCFSVYVWNRHVLLGVAKKIKTANPSIFLIAGGVEVTASPKSFYEENEKVFDCIVCGEGENVVGAIVKTFLEKGEKPTETIIYGTPCNLEEAVSPYLDGTLDVSKYSGALWELARGCPYSCSYCYESKGEKKVRNMPRKRLSEELDYFVKAGIGQVFVLDPTYNVDKKRALEILKIIEQKAPGLFFHFECRPEFIDVKLARAFSQIPCSLQIGLQSSSEKVLTTVNRTFNRKEFIKNVGFLNEAGVVFGFDLIYGLPGDNFEGFMKSIDFALELYPNHVEIFQLSVLPGTDLFDRAKNLQISFMPTAPYLVQETKTFSKDDIQKAKNLSLACSLFYTQGRAVPWFLSLIKPLQKNPSTFFLDFLQFMKEKNVSVDKHYTFEDIVWLQKDFIKMLYTQKNIKHLIRFAADSIDLNASISAYVAEGKESQVSLNYHPDDILSPYSQDPKYFVKHAEKFPCTVEVSLKIEKETGELYSIVY